MADVQGKTVAILATNGFEQSELLEPRQALEDAGIHTQIVALEGGTIRGWKEENWGEYVSVDITAAEANPDSYDALLLPGGVMSPDKLRRDADVQKFVRAFFDAGKPIAAICHGPWTLIDAGVVQGRKLTSYHSIQTDLKNAGADWVDEEVVVDRGLVTSRKPSDLDAFIGKTIEEIAEGPHVAKTQRATTGH